MIDFFREGKLSNIRNNNNQPCIRGKRARNWPVIICAFLVSGIFPQQR